MRDSVHQKPVTTSVRSLTNARAERRPHGNHYLNVRVYKLSAILHSMDWRIITNRLARSQIELLQRNFKFKNLNTSP